MYGVFMAGILMSGTVVMNTHENLLSVSYRQPRFRGQSHYFRIRISTTDQRLMDVSHFAQVTLSFGNADNTVRMLSKTRGVWRQFEKNHAGSVEESKHLSDIFRAVCRCGCATHHKQ